MKCKTVPSVCIYGYVDSFTRKVVVLPVGIFYFFLGRAMKNSNGKCNHPIYTTFQISFSCCGFLFSSIFNVHFSFQFISSCNVIIAPCSMKILRDFNFADWRFFCGLREQIFAVRDDRNFWWELIFAILCSSSRIFKWKKP